MISSIVCFQCKRTFKFCPRYQHCSSYPVSVRFNPFTENFWGRRLNSLGKGLNSAHLQEKGGDFGVQSRVSL